MFHRRTTGIVAALLALGAAARASSQPLSCEVLVYGPTRVRVIDRWAPTVITHGPSIGVFGSCAWDSDGGLESDWAWSSAGRWGRVPGYSLPVWTLGRYPFGRPYASSACRSGVVRPAVVPVHPSWIGLEPYASSTAPAAAFYARPGSGDRVITRWGRWQGRVIPPWALGAGPTLRRTFTRSFEAPIVEPERRVAPEATTTQAVQPAQGAEVSGPEAPDPALALLRAGRAMEAAAHYAVRDAQRRGDEARALEAALASDPPGPAPAPERSALLLQGLALAVAGQFKLSEQAMLRAIAEDPSVRDRAASGASVLGSSLAMRAVVNRAVPWAHRAQTGSAWRLVAELMEFDGRPSDAQRMRERAAEIDAERRLGRLRSLPAGTRPSTTPASVPPPAPAPGAEHEPDDARARPHR